jgi:hypothetical protein
MMSFWMPLAFFFAVIFRSFLPLGCGTGASAPSCFGLRFAALRHCDWGEYNALRHDCQGFFDALRQKLSKCLNSLSL